VFSGSNGNTISIYANDGDIGGSANIFLSKLASTTASRALVSDGSGLISAATTTATEIGYVNGVTSAIQTQLDAKTLKSTLTAKGSIYVATGASTPAELIVGSDNQILVADSVQATGVKWAAASSLSLISRNYLYNGEFRFIQRWDSAAGATNAVDEDEYGFDRWYMLHENAATNSINVSREDPALTASPSQYAGKFVKTDAGNDQIALAQILPYQESITLRGKELTFAFYAKTASSEVTSLRACIGEWSGTADSVTSDVVATWGTETPTWIANFDCANTPADLTISDTWAQVSVTGTLDAATNNVVVVIWTDNSEAQNDEFYITQTQLIDGSAAAEWTQIAKSYQQDLAECQRFFEKSYDVDTTLLTATNAGQRSERASGTAHQLYVQYETRKFSDPTVTLYNPDGSGNNCEDLSTGTDLTCTVSASAHNTRGFTLSITSSVDGNSVATHFGASAEL
jgi:hypothetical protein